jgi:hypothetical protein
MTRTKTLAVAAVLALALALTAYALAAGETGTVASYTGCLKNGKIESVAVGDTPLAPCGAGGTQVRLSGGDVTAVAAGSGLTGGGSNGDLTLAADPAAVQTRVSENCLRTDASISAIRQDGTVACNPDDKGPGTDVFAGFHDDLTLVPVDTSLSPAPIATLPVPGGAYAITATLDVESASLGGNEVRCELRAGADFDRTDIGLGGVFEPVGTGDARLALDVVHQFDAAGDVVVACASADTAYWHFLKIVATRVSTISNGPLSSP